jgi:hypothetical protein
MQFLILILCFLSPLYSFGIEGTTLQILGELPEDCNLLEKVQILSDEERKLLSPEYDSILRQLRIRIHARMKGDIEDKTLLHEELSAGEALLIFGPSLGIDNYLTNADVRTVLSESFSPQFYFVRFSAKAKVASEDYFNEDELEEIYQTAKKILETTDVGDHLISLGQSPAYITEALEELASTDESQENYRVIYKVPYSGAPDCARLNSHYKSLQLSNLMTPQSLTYYKQLLRDKGICPLQLGSHRRVYVMDLIGTGGSVASFLKLLVNWYRSSGISLPEFKLLDMGVENRHFKKESRVVLPLAENCEMHIDRCFVHTTAHLSDKLDYTEGEDRMIPPFGALLWKPEYERVYHQYPNAYARGIIASVRSYVRSKKSNQRDLD